MEATFAPQAQDRAAGDHFWTTDTLEKHSKMSRWSGIVSENMTEMAVNSDNPEHFRASWRQYSLGPLQLNCIEASPQNVRRTPWMVTRGGEPSYELIYMRQGSVRVRYLDHEDGAGPGEFALLCNDLPYEFFCPSESVALTLHFSESWLQRWVPQTDCFAAANKDFRNAWGAPLAAILSTIANRGFDGATLPRHVIADQVGAMLTLMVGLVEDPGSRHKQALLSRLRRLLRERFDDVDLNPESLARAANVSKRYLHCLFAGAGTSFGRELNELRLQRGESLLRDVRHARYRIGEIAAMVGFDDPSRFARLFKIRYGVNPAAYRLLSR